MSRTILPVSFVLLCLLPLPYQAFAQVKISEFSPVNTGQIQDEDGDRSDWIELYNVGVTSVDLTGYSIADEKNPGKWTFPSVVLAPSERLLVFASGKDRGGDDVPGGIDHWETAVYESSTWRYFVGTQEPPADWTQPGFVDAGWPSGPGGLGYGDNDDATALPTGIASVFMRRSFLVNDPAVFESAILSIDYDDGFIAYLNGEEIARSNNFPLGSPVFSTLVSPEHEAVMYTGGLPEQFPISKVVLQAALLPGNNVLAIQVHNTALSSSDFTARPWLHMGLNTPQVIFGANPSWFDPLGGQGPNGEMHTNFKISQGEKLFLFDADEDIVDSVTVPYLQVGHSLARLNDDGDWCVAAVPTPNDANAGNCEADYAATPLFSPAPGFYALAQTVSVMGGGIIRYTTDGSDPVSSSPILTGGIQVDASTVLKARRFESFRLPSAVATGTYFIGEKTTLPVVSVSFDPADFTGFYTNYSDKIAANVEYFDKNKQRQFSNPSSAYVVGNWSVAFPQKSIQFDTEEDYGATGPFRYRLFAEDKPIDAFRSFRIRNEDDDFNLARMRDRVVNQIALQTHAVAAGNSNVLAFLNGQYWGLYSGRERLDNYFCRDNFGCDPDSVTMVKTHFGQAPYQAEYGNIEDFYTLTDFMANNDLGIQANFDAVAADLDVENFADYFATEIFVASTDWLQDYFNNVRLFKCSSPKVKWKFMLWDVSYSSGAGSGCVNCDVLGSTLADPFDTRYGKMFRAMLDNTAYKRYFINRFADLMNYHYTPAKVHAVIDRNAEEMAPEINRHDALWGTSDSTAWRGHVESLKGFYSERAAYQRQHLIDNFQLNGTTEVTLAVNPPGAGVIRISTITPEELPWTGTYFKGVPVRLTAIANPGYSFANWSPNAAIPTGTLPSVEVNISTENIGFQANFTGVAAERRLTVSEVNYHSADNADAGDWLELVNFGTSPLDLGGYTLRDQNWYNRYEIPVGTVLGANQYLVLQEDKIRLESAHPGVSGPLPDLGFDLSNKSDEIHLYDRTNAELVGFRYEDGNPWPNEPDGDGYTLERKDFAAPANAASNWFAGCIGGSPGMAYDPDCAVSTDEQDSVAPSLILSPNPAHGIVLLRSELPITGIKVYDTLGKCVLQMDQPAPNPVFDVSQWPNGTYFVKVQMEKEYPIDSIVRLIRFGD
jgi:hypothetical protein